MALPDDPGAADALGSAWDHAIEEGIDDVVRPILPTWSRPPRLRGKNCDRWFSEGIDLFLVDVKNIRPGESLGMGSGHDFKNWLRSKFFKKDGFPQIESTLVELDRAGHRFGARKLRRFRAIWPIVLCWTHMPGHPHVTDLLQRIRDERPSEVPETLRTRMRPPLILDYDTFFRVLSCLPALRARGVTLGEAVDGYLSLRVERPLNLAEYLIHLAPEAIMPPEMIDVMRAALDAVKLIGESMKSTESP
ncbi:MAG: hypothetical protein ABMB14_13270 [Myxococcota bacterium]